MRTSTKYGQLVVQPHRQEIEQPEDERKGSSDSRASDIIKKREKSNRRETLNL